jgi:hypothetical protein
MQADVPPDRAAQRDVGTPGRRTDTGHAIAFTPVSARPMMSFCTWLVPS